MATATPRELSGLIDQLTRGEDPGAAAFAAFSDLSRTEVGQLREAWDGIPLEIRSLMVVRALDLTEDNVDFDFTQLAVIALDDEAAPVREHAAQALWESPHREVAAKLVARLREDDDPDVRAAAAASLRQFVLLREFEQFDQALGDDVVEALREAIGESDDPALRASALEAVGARSLEWVGESIAEAYNDDDRGVRLASVRAMGDSAEERWLDYLLEQLYSDDPEFRYAAAESCALVGSEEAVEPLVGLLADEDAEVVLATIAALGEIGGDEALDALREYSENAPPEFEEAVADAIQAAAEFASGSDEDDDDEDEDEE